MAPPRVVSIGEVLWDMLPDGERFGGAPANFACHAARLGADVSMVSAVGDDKRGRKAIEILRGHEINVDEIVVDKEAATGTVGVELDPEGRPTFTIHRGSAWDRMQFTESLHDKIKASDAVYFGTLGQRSESSRATIRQAVTVAERLGIPRILDVNLRAPFFDQALILHSVGHASVLKISFEELADVCRACGISTAGPPASRLGELAESYQLDTVVMTRGAEGAMLVSARGVTEEPGVPVDVVDTVGAGDAFAAALLLGILRGEPDGTNLRHACTVASEACTHAGAVPANPNPPRSHGVSK